MKTPIQKDGLTIGYMFASADSIIMEFKDSHEPRMKDIVKTIDCSLNILESRLKDGVLCVKRARVTAFHLPELCND